MYGQPGCYQCKTMLKHLEKIGVKAQYRDVTEDEAALKWVQDMGYQGVPVTRVGFRHFQGFDPDELERSLAVLA